MFVLIYRWDDGENTHDEYHGAFDTMNQIKHHINQIGILSEKRLHWNTLPVKMVKDFCLYENVGKTYLKAVKIKTNAKYSRKNVGYINNAYICLEY